MNQLLELKEPREGRSGPRDGRAPYHPYPTSPSLGWVGKVAWVVLGMTRAFIIGPP